jgi:hypothetical protein
MGNSIQSTVALSGKVDKKRKPAKNSLDNIWVKPQRVFFFGDIERDETSSKMQNALRVTLLMTPTQHLHDACVMSVQKT